jgi:flagellar hook-associated protein 1 FlgK
MSGLFQALQTTSNTLDAFSRSIETEGLNVSNASSPGWAALQVTIRPIGPSGAGSDVVDISSTSDARADAVVRSATAEASFSQTASSQVSPINQVFDITGTSGILGALRNFSTAFSQLAVNPSDSGLRSASIDAANGVALAFNQVATSLDGVQSQTDTAIQSTVGQINSLSSTIAGYNAQLRGSPAFDPQLNANLRNALDSLSSLINISTSTNKDGTVTVLAGGSLPLVSEDQTWPVGVNTAAAPGSQLVSSAGGVAPTKILGSLGGLLDVRNNVTSALLGGNGQAGSLNTLAAGFASRVNALLSSGTTDAGTPGAPIFTFDQTDPSNVARTLAIDPTVGAADLGLASATQSNGIANSLASLSTSTQTADQITLGQTSQSAESLFASIAAGIGQHTSDLASSAQLDASAQTSAETSRQNVSGVSLDKEAVQLTAGQRAYEAVAKLFSTLDTLTETEVNLIK